jgi:glycosyltransferase involved in cell wall biosynthesis
MQEAIDVELFTLRADPAHVEGVRLRVCPSWPGFERLGVSPSMKRELSIAAAGVDIVHSHGLWMMPNIYPGRAVRGTDCKLVMSPRGTLSGVARARSTWLKSVVWKCGQESALRDAACLHATCEQEYFDIRDRDLFRPVALIPNGVDVPEIEDGQVYRTQGPRRTLLFLVRLHPVKGIEDLLHAWVACGPATEDWELKIVGPGPTSYRAELEDLVQRLGARRVVFHGPAYGDERARMYLRANLYVLPSHTENFAVTVAEAMAHGVPVITTTATPWSELRAQGCGWCVEPNREALTEVLKFGLGLSDAELEHRGLRGRQWMQRDYAWERVGKEMAAVYAWLTGRGDRPMCVRLD